MKRSTSWLISIGLIAANLISAMAVIYVTDTHRRLVSQKHDLERQVRFMKTEKNRLLLEHSALTSPIRVQNIAQDKLNMHQPSPHETDIIYVQDQ